MIRLFYALSPKGYRNWMKRYVGYCNFDTTAEKMINFFSIFGIGIGLGAAVLGYLFFDFSVLYGVASGAAGFSLFMVLTHLSLIMIADSRANFVESILPDALQIISSNLRSGLTPDKAILASARPEFGPLEAELKKVSRETLSGIPFDESLSNITKKINSKVLEKTVTLLIEGMEKGGSLNSLLERVSEDIRQSKMLRNEIKSFVMMYGIFIFFAASFGAPILYSVSTFMVDTMGSLSSQVSIDATASISTVSFFNFEPSPITSEFLIQYSAVAILVTSIFGGLLIGLIQDGNEKAGLKFIPILLGVSFAIFFGSQFVLRSFLSIG